MKDMLINILKEEVKPALGCTEPGAVALACAKARELAGETLKECKVFVSPNIYKNGMGVGIPGADEVGLMIAACMGVTGGDASLGLNALESINEETSKLAVELSTSNKVKIFPAETDEKVFIDVEFEAEEGTSKVTIREKHDKFVFVKKNDQVILDEAVASASTQVKKSGVADMTIEEIVKTVESMELSEIGFMLDGVKMNMEISNDGLSRKLGAGVGYGMKMAAADGFVGEDLVNTAIMITAGASDARMSGLNKPVMSSNGSGNHGLTAILPIAAYNQKFPQSDERLAKALAISHLVTAYVKSFTGRLSAVCGCGVAASTGASAGIAWLMDLDIKGIEGAIANMVANLSGMICDGAKAGCAYKLASAAGAAVQSALFAKYGSIVPELNGIVGRSVEESIQNLGKVSNDGMTITDGVIVNVMSAMNCC